MNSKRLNLILTIIVLLVVMSGCSISSELISIDTPLSDVTNDGIFTVILTYPLAQAINFLSQYIGVFFAVALVTVVLNAIIIALTFKSNVAMQRMQDIQPEVQKIQMKYEGRKDQASQQKMSYELQNLYQKYDINPMGSLLTTFIQFPVLISMYAAVRRSAAVANGTFLGASLSMTPREAFASKTWVIIFIYIAMIVLQFLSTSIVRWLQIAKLKKEAEKKHKPFEKPANQNAFMMYGMVVFIGFIMLSWPAALSLYYSIYSIVNIAKTIIIDKLTTERMK